MKRYIGQFIVTGLMGFCVGALVPLVLNGSYVSGISLPLYAQLSGAVSAIICLVLSFFWVRKHSEAIQLPSKNKNGSLFESIIFVLASLTLLSFMVLVPGLFGTLTLGGNVNLAGYYIFRGVVFAFLIMSGLLFGLYFLLKKYRKR